MQETRFEEDEFKDLRFNPFLDKGQSIFDKYPIFKKFDEFTRPIDTFLEKEQVMKYILILYQPGSPLLALDTISERKWHAATLAGYKIDPTTKKFSSRIEKVINCDDPEINAMILRVCRLSRNRVFTKMVKYDEALYRNEKKLMEGGHSKEKLNELLKNDETLNELLDKVETEYLNQDINQNLIEMLYDNIDASELGISPEDIASARAEGRLETVLPNPYYE